MSYNVFVTKAHRAILTVMASVPKERRGGKYFDESVITADSDGHKYLYPGMVLAETSDGVNYVPYSLGASYGTYSDTAIGMLNEFTDLSLLPKMVSPVTEGTFIEAYCYIYGGTLGTISAAVKSSLSHIQWK